MTDSFVLHTDGGCSPNPGPGGWAFVLGTTGGAEIERYGGESDSTNNRMELTAVIRGLETALEASGGRPRVEIVADSQYVLKGMNEWMPGWKANGWTRKSGGRRQPVLNVDLWKRLDELKGLLDLKFTWVKGHSGHDGNERCDELVKRGIRENS
jgi:ribonuclease HI